MALAAGQAGFSRLVATLFPLVGYAGFLLLGGLAYYVLKEILALRPAFPGRLVPAPARRPILGAVLERRGKAGEKERP
ncbi:hypothetical protein MOTHE_c19090 [Moorella thermoacetica]|uniref:hypothetical protein n=1 Tax=Neomoorella thermoacetica TaxID=1525 RepID=UPI00069F43BC|nr:hypothetical protein [Moorella thermoacetica]AKX94693.1 hypothetical protein MOTHE_c19090 [Moorella thermoacetica]